MCQLSDTQIHDIALAMTQGRRSLPAPTLGIPGFYTYIGQMISHDIVPNTNPFERVRNTQPMLNLGSVYGDASGNDLRFAGDSAPFLVQHRFQLARNSNGLTDVKRWPRDKKQLACIAEPRNEENAIILQLHILWMRYHNALIRSGLACDAWQARQLVALTFQWLVYHEFLPIFLAPRVYKALFEQGMTLYDYPHTDTVPSFFSHAAFRFGHSGIRPFYLIHRHNGGFVSASLADMFSKGVPLADHQQIDWQVFYAHARFSDRFEHTRNHAMPIDTSVASEMAAINRHNPHFSTVNIVERNLQAARAIKLDTGTAFYAAIAANTSAATAVDLQPVTDFATSPLASVNGLSVEDLPLWLYVLLEAETQHLGQHLGTVGSVLVGEVIKRAMTLGNMPLLDASGLVSARAKSRMTPLFKQGLFTGLRPAILDVVSFVQQHEEPAHVQP